MGLLLLLLLLLLLSSILLSFHLFYLFQFGLFVSILHLNLYDKQLSLHFKGLSGKN